MPGGGGRARAPQEQQPARGQRPVRVEVPVALERRLAVARAVTSGTTPASFGRGSTITRTARNRVRVDVADRRRRSSARSSARRASALTWVRSTCRFVRTAPIAIVSVRVSASAASVAANSRPRSVVTSGDRFVPASSQRPDQAGRPSLRRSCATWTSTVRVPPGYSTPQTRSSKTSRDACPRSCCRTGREL